MKRPWKSITLCAAIALTATACGGAATTEDSTDRNPGNPAATTGFDGTTIKLGVLGAFSGPVAVIGEPMTQGHRVWFEHLNAQGGIAGKYPVELVQEDTRYNADEAVRQYNKIKGGVAAFVQLLGTAPTQAVLPQLENDNILGVPGSLDGLWVTEDHLLPVGAPYQIQAINAVEHYITGDGNDNSTICTMSQDDVVGDAAEEGADHAATERNIEIASKQRFKPGTENYAGQIAALRRTGCEMVILATTPSDAAKVWGAAAQANYTPQWYGITPTYLAALATSPVGPYLQEHVIIIAEGGEWGDESIPGMREMLANLNKYAPEQEPDQYFVLGYVMARALTAALEKAIEIGDLSRAGLQEAARQLGTLSFDGLASDYTYGTTQNRVPPREVTLFTVDPDKPLGLAAFDSDVTSDSAQSFRFGRQ